MRRMRQVKRSALVAETPERMFELINDVERYPEFVPWCVGSRLISRGPAEVVAALDVRRGLLRASFTTRNTLVGASSMRMDLVEGPFKSLAGLWTLDAIQEPGGAALGCRVTLEMRFEFSNPVSGALLEPVFEHTVASLVDAFVARARQLRAAPPA
jgi:ribosome-associated toxin RatA of RatAB toxin-antitoxin module